MRGLKVSGTTTAQWSYYLARLKCGLVKGKHIDEVFGSKTALVWLARSGNADQLSKFRGQNRQLSPELGDMGNVTPSKFNF